MTGNLYVVAVAAALSLTSVATAAEPVARPKSVSCSIPNYPKEWIDEDLEGTVRLAVLVGADGTVKDAKVIESSGHLLLDKASRRASSTCKFGAPGWTTVKFKWVTD